MTAAAPPRFTGYQKLIVAIIAFLQFTIILDFMILSPLGAQILPALRITTAQFGVLVSAYAFSAAISSVLAAGFSDRFDRKRLLLFFYAGFTLGTLLCALARDYHFLLFARMVTGLFGGVIGSTVLAITTDLFDYRLRGRVMGFVQTAFAASNVLGLPLGLLLSNRWGWHAPFLLIVASCVAVGVVIVVAVRPIDAHLRERPDSSALHHLLHTVSQPRYLQGFATTGLLMVGGFMLMPFASAFSVNNLGVALDRLPWVYMITGICTLIAGPLIGRASDALGKFPVFAWGCLGTSIMVLIYTHLGRTPLGLVILVNALLFIGVSTRMIASSALISAVPSPLDRGSYNSISASVQQMSGGLAATAGGLIVSQGSDGRILHFDVVGYALVLTTALSLWMMYRVQRQLEVAAAAASAAGAAGAAGTADATGTAGASTG